MSNITNKFLLAGDKFMSEIHLRFMIWICVRYFWTIPKKTKQEYKDSWQQGTPGIFTRTN